jgi:DHA3 family macrolide efflux protein-like MFS transporter
MSIAVDTAKRLSPFAVFQNGNFSKMWTGQLVSTMGTALTSLAASIYVFQETGSAMSVGLMLMATAAPSLLVGLFAGVLVDRYDRKRIMVIADILRAVLVFLIPILVPLSIFWLYGIVMVTSAIGQFFDPAQESVLPEVASEEELAAANSLMAISSFGATAIGFAASGLLASAANLNWAFYLDAISFLFSAFCIFLVRVKPIQAEGETNAKLVIRNLKVGVQQLFDTPILRSLFTSSLPTLVAFGLSNALLLPFALRALKATEFEYGLQEGLTSLGFVAGSLVMASIFDRMREGAWIAIGFIGMALLSIAYSFTHSIPMAIAIVAISGFFNAPSAIGRRTAVQRNTPREMRGRVNSVFFVSRDILFLIGMAAAGLADYVDVRWMYFSSAILLLAGGALVLVLPGLRQNRADWRQALKLLKTAPTRTGLGIGRLAVPADMDTLVGLLPPLAALSNRERTMLISQAHVLDATAGTTILRHGEGGDAAYFILSGRAAAGIATAEGNYRSLSTMAAGDFFGEIAALTGAPRTADVVAVENTSLMQVPAQALRDLMANPALSNLFLAKMSERLARTSLTELPRFAGVDQKDVRELRTVTVDE